MHKQGLLQRLAITPVTALKLCLLYIEWQNLKSQGAKSNALFVIHMLGLWWSLEVPFFLDFLHNLPHQTYSLVFNIITI